MNNYLCENGAVSIFKNDVSQKSKLKRLIKNVCKHLLLPQDVGDKTQEAIFESTKYYLSLIENKGINTQMVSMQVLAKNISLLSGDSLKQYMLGNFDHVLIGLIDDYIRSLPLKMSISIIRWDAEEVRQVLVTYINAMLGKKQLIQVVTVFVIERYLRGQLKEFDTEFVW